jgi:hypothetical protein
MPIPFAYKCNFLHIRDDIQRKIWLSIARESPRRRKVLGKEKGGARPPRYFSCKAIYASAP